MDSLIYTLFVIIGTVKSNPEIIPQISKEDSVLNTCIESVLDHVTEERALFLYSDLWHRDITDKNADLATRLGSHIRHFDVSTETLQFGRFTYFSFMITDQVKYVNDYFNSTVKSLGFLSDTKYLIVYLGDEDLRRIFKITWRAYVKRIIVLDKNNNFYTSATWRDFCGKSNKPAFIFNCANVNHTKITEIYSYSFKNMYGCEVRALAVVKEPFVVHPNESETLGVEQRMFEIIEEKLNFTLTYVNNYDVAWGHMLLDGSFNRTVGRLFRREGDIMFGNFFANGSFLYDFQACYPYLQSELAFYLPREKLEGNWKAAMKVFSNELWLYLILVTIFVQVTLNLFALFVRRLKLTSDHYSIEVLAILLRVPVSQPKITIIRTVFMLWTLCAYIFASSYETTLLSFLIRPEENYEIQTGDQLIKSKMKFGGLRFAKDLFADPNTDIYHKWIDCPLDPSCLNRTAFQRDMATIDSRVYFHYNVKYYYDKSGMLLLRQLPISYTFYSWVLMNKGFPLQHLLDDIISHLTEFGILQKFKADTLAHISYNVDSTHEPLELKQLLMCFYILLAGYIVSALVFLFEYMFLYQTCL